MSNCAFCELLQEQNKAFFYQDPSGLFAAMWTSLPAYPGHALVMPKRHLQYFRDMDDDEMRQIACAVAAVKTKIEQTDLKEVCTNLRVISDEARVLIDRALELLEVHNYEPPTAFNDGINDGPAAGQTVPHLHWHILPRWGDSGEGVVHKFKHEGHTL